MIGYSMAHIFQQYKDELSSHCNNKTEVNCWCCQHQLNPIDFVICRRGEVCPNIPAYCSVNYECAFLIV
jgi:hypothetical protein